MPVKTAEKSLHIQVGYSCNNSCLFCMEAEKEKRFRLVKYFLKGRVYEVLEKNKGMKKVFFATGEPTLNPNLARYIRYAKGKKYKEIVLVSNGRKYADPKLVSALIGAGVTEFIVSLHGHDRKTHDGLTTVRGSFAETVSGLRVLSRFRRKIPVRITISHVVNKKNYKSLRNFLEFCRSYPIDSIVLNVVQPLGENMQKNFKALMPRYKDLQKVVEELYLKHRSLFVSSLTGEDYVIITDLPLCRLGKGSELGGYGKRTIIEKDGKKTIFTTAKFKEKREACGACKYARVCDGVFGHYVERFGWEEFEPIK
jgi:cyclic pyranopterin phosphate synthase